MVVKGGFELFSFTVNILFYTDDYQGGMDNSEGKSKIKFMLIYQY